MAVDVYPKRPASLALGRIPRAGRRLRQALPIANYEGIHPLAPAQLREWAVLDTFDMLAPAHDRPQSERTLSVWFASAGLRDVEVFRAGVVVGRGVRRRPPSDAGAGGPIPGVPRA